MQGIEELKAAVVRAALSLAAEKSWTDISFYKISQKSGFDEADVRAVFRDKEAIISAYMQQVDDRVSLTVDESEGEARKLNAIFFLIC